MLQYARQHTVIYIIGRSALYFSTKTHDAKKNGPSKMMLETLDFYILVLFGAVPLVGGNTGVFVFR